MPTTNSYIYIIAGCLLIILSYLYNIISKRVGIPSVLLLLITGIAVRELILAYNETLDVPAQAVEIFGIVGLIMIVLEAGLDLEVSRQKRQLILNAFTSALIIFVISASACSFLLYYYLHERYLSCLVYAIPLSIVSSAIVIPSISHLENDRREFLVYETSFSDIIGIIAFNYIVGGNIAHPKNILFFIWSTLISFALSIVLSAFLMFLLTRITTKIRFFLIFAVLIFLYAGGKLLHLPSLLMILLFGMIASNWERLPLHGRLGWIRNEKVDELITLMHSLTAETSFLIRTFFFFIFGLTIDLRLLMNLEVVMAGGLIVIILLVIRYIYLRFILRSHIFPELFFMPRGLITILLFYSIPEAFKLSKFNTGILFFVILVTSIVMAIGSFRLGKPVIQAIHDEIPFDEGRQV